MKKPMLKLFFYWINERHAIYQRRFVEKKPGPWTKDKILREFKFTNVFRQLDRVTDRLTGALLRLRPYDADKVLFAVCVFRMFNWPQTYETLEAAGLHIKWDERAAYKLLKARQRNGHQIFTGAYIITNNGKKTDKVLLVCRALTKLYKAAADIAIEVRDSRSVAHAVEVLSRYDMIGRFVAYELATDLRHTPLLSEARDVMTWANPGPGAQRGLNRLHGRPVDKRVPLQQALVEMRALLAVANTYTGKYVPALEMRDVEHSLCEFDKYMRVKLGQGKPRSKFRPYVEKK